MKVNIVVQIIVKRIQYNKLSEMNRFFHWVVLMLLFSAVHHGQSTIDVEFQKKYEENIKKSRINDVYIPKDIHDAMIELNKLSDEEGRTTLLQGEEKVVKERLMIGLGRWMMVNWNFYEGSRLSHSLRELGLSHPEDMAKFIIVTYYRHLKGHDLELESRAAKYYEERKMQQAKRDSSKIVVNH